MARKKKKNKQSHKEFSMFERMLSGRIFIGVCLLFFSCNGPVPEIDNDFILKTAGITLDRNSFVEELDLKLAAYPYDFKSRPLEYNQLVIGLVRTLSEESILLATADQIGLVVSDQELETAVAEYKSDYPGDSFEQILLKNAISYPFWLHRFKKQMIIDRLIDSQLHETIEISAEEMVAFYQNYQAALSNHQAGNSSGDLSVIQKIDNEKELVSRLKMQKTQEKYEHWIKELEKKYPVEINNDQIKAFLIKIETDEGKKE